MLTLISPWERRATPAITLSPTQRKAADGVLRALERGDLAVLQDYTGDGKTTVLRHVQAELGGSLIGVREFLTKLPASEPFAIDEAFLCMVEAEVAQHDLVLVDDLHLVKDVTESGDYPRSRLFDAVITALCATIQAAGKKAVFATDEVPRPLAKRAHISLIQDLAAADFRVICSAYLDPAISARMDFEEIHRFVPNLNAHQLRKAALWLSHEPGCDTARFCQYLNVDHLTSNVEVKEVEAVTWNDLKGVDDVIEQLEAKVALPFENRELATQWELKPKRGVLLAGPPGTGKTTIGRALAHRLRGKFFLVDGTMISGSSSFYCEIDRVFAAAENNAPSIVFIDDADVIFGGKKESGLYRYLLTKLDGLESRGAGRICVMMTAMEPADLPAAILRSGRVELWLETRLPDVSAREQILREKLTALPEPFCSADFRMLAEVTRSFTGADLKAITEDAKLGYAHDRVKAKPPRSVEQYFADAVAALRKNRAKYRKRKPVNLAEPSVFGFGANGAGASARTALPGK